MDQARSYTGSSWSWPVNCFDKVIAIACPHFLPHLNAYSNCFDKVIAIACPRFLLHPTAYSMATAHCHPSASWRFGYPVPLLPSFHCSCRCLFVPSTCHPFPALPNHPAPVSDPTHCLPANVGQWPCLEISTMSCMMSSIGATSCVISHVCVIIGTYLCRSLKQQTSLLLLFAFAIWTA